MNTETKTYDELLATAQRVETTTGMNGYPERLKAAYTADTLTELRELKEAAEAAGHEVTIIDLHRRNGWALWERRGGSWDLSPDLYQRTGSNEWALTITNESDILKEAFDIICGEGYEVEDAQDLFSRADRVRELADELPDPDELEDGESVVVFMDMNSGDYGINYTVRTEQNGYSYDTHQHKMALLIEERDEDEE